MGIQEADVDVEVHDRGGGDQPRALLVRSPEGLLAEAAAYSKDPQGQSWMPPMRSLGKINLPS